MKHQTFTNVARLLLGGPVERSDCEGLWRAVAFANLPGPSAGSRTEPELSESDKEAGATELALVMSRLAPDCLIIFDALLAEALIDREPAASAILARPNDWVTVPHPGAPGFGFREHMGGVRALLGRSDEGNRAVDH
jgi:hypothetical protein